MKRKQIIVLGLVLVIITVGILQYNSGGAGQAAKATLMENNLADSGNPAEEIPGAAVYVNGETDKQNASVTGDTDTEQASAQVKATGYFAQARLDRDKARSRKKEELKALSESSDPANPASLEAQEMLVDVISRGEIETTVETLIKQRGFEDVLVCLSDSGYIDVIVKASSLSSKQVAQISDIVVRHAKVGMESITVRNEE